MNALGRGAWLALVIAVWALASPPLWAWPPEHSVPVSWNFEAPDMIDVADFNESGQASVPLAYESDRCGEQISVLSLHMFQFITGSTRGTNRKPSTIDAGIVVNVEKRNGHPERLKVTIEGGDDDWSSTHSFAVPALSAKQWNQLPSTASWVFERQAMTLPRFWKRVLVSCSRGND